MMKYLLWFVCLLRGHCWLFETDGLIPNYETDNLFEGIPARRSKCQRCGMHKFEPIP